MKFWKHVMLVTVAFLGIATTVLYTACEKDSCFNLTCKNGGSCASGRCNCPTGFEGTECETRAVARFIGTYIGYNSCSNMPSLVDTVDIFPNTDSTIVGIVIRSDKADTLIGTPDVTASSYMLTIATDTATNYKRQYYASLNAKSLTFSTYTYTTVGDSVTKQVCNFTGSK